MLQAAAAVEEGNGKDDGKVTRDKSGAGCSTCGGHGEEESGSQCLAGSLLPQAAVSGQSGTGREREPGTSGKGNSIKSWISWRDEGGNVVLAERPMIKLAEKNPAKVFSVEFVLCCMSQL